MRPVAGPSLIVNTRYAASLALSELSGRAMSRDDLAESHNQPDVLTARKKVAFLSPMIAIVPLLMVPVRGERQAENRFVKNGRS